MYQSSVPYILFGEQQVKLLRIILRDRFAASLHGEQFFRRSCHQSTWEICSTSEWYDGIKEYATSYMDKYTRDVPHESDIEMAIGYLFHRNIMNKIHGGMRGYSIA